MKGILLSLGCCLLLVSINAHSARWIVEGAKLNVDPIRNIKVLKHIKIGEKDFSVLETPGLQVSSSSQKNIMKLTNANRVFEDLPIYLDQPIFEQEDKSASGWHVQRMKYDQLNPNYQGQGITVAVLDTGVDITHPQLASKIWTNPNEIPDNNIDDDANGYIDDVHGWNFGDDNNTPTDDQGHGTHCAGIIAADQDPNSIARGVAPMAQIMPVKIISSNNQAFLSDAAEAIVYAANNGAKVLSNSWGLYASWVGYNINPQSLQIFVDAVTHAYYMGTVYIASAGNDSLNLDESNLRDLRIPLGIGGMYNMIGVASGDFDGAKDVRSFFTNYGANYVHFATPGSNILSTIPGGWRSMSGTSMATPLFAGIFARVMSKGYTWFEAADIIRQTVDEDAKPAWDGKIKYGFVNAEAALQ